MLRNTSRNRNILVSIGVYILLVLSFSGTLIGTYAWFSYNTRANSTYRGTAVNNRGELKIGIYSETELLNAEELSLIKDNDNPNVYWGSGGLKPDQLTYYLETVGYASNSMNACTSSSRDYEGDLDLHTYPTALDNSFIHVSANKKDYVYLPLVFSMPGQEDPSNLYINEANVRSNGNLNKAVRIHVASELTKFVFAPCNALDGYNEVGGVLNLDTKDSYYDYLRGREFAYGEFEDLIYKYEKTEGETSVDNPSTFNAVHKEGVYAIDFERSIVKKSYFYGYESIFNKEKAIAKVNGGYNRVDLTVYLEGWDRSLDNSELDNYFNLDLTFEVGA